MASGHRCTAFMEAQTGDTPRPRPFKARQAISMERQKAGESDSGLSTGSTNTAISPFCTHLQERLMELIRMGRWCRARTTTSMEQLRWEAKTVRELFSA